MGKYRKGGMSYESNRKNRIFKKINDREEYRLCNYSKF